MDILRLGKCSGANVSYPVIFCRGNAQWVKIGNISWLLNIAAYAFISCLGIRTKQIPFRTQLQNNQRVCVCVVLYLAIVSVLCRT